MIYKLVILVFILISATPESMAQEENKLTKHFIYTEIGGPATVASINYEFAFFNKDNFNINGRVGIGSAHLKDFERKLNPDFYIPIGINGRYAFHHNEKSYYSFELGIGNTFSSVVHANSLYVVERKNNIHGYIATSLGWYFNSGIFTCISYTPTIENYKTLRHWGSLSIGYSF